MSAYFSNATEADFFRENQCFVCKNYKYDKDTGTWGCPIWDVHILFSTHGNTEVHKARAEILDFLIPRKRIEGAFASFQNCSMFNKKKKDEARK